jgi:hypothetical protein
MDTIALSIPPDDFTILDHDAFSPSSRGLLLPPYYPLRRGGFSCINNPLRVDMERFGYFPRMTLSKRPARCGFNVLLRVEASLPKLKYGQNFSELKDDDLDFICNRLLQQMERRGVRVTIDAIRRAQVSMVHYSKNLPLTDYTRCSMVIREIARGSVTRLLDSVKTDYYNDGSAIRFHATNHEMIIYDKLKDLERGRISDKRSFEDNNALQLDLLATPFQKSFEVLRQEVRLNNRKKITAVLERLNKVRPLTMESLFDSSLAKAVLLHYWQMMMPDVPLLVTSGFASGEVYDALRREMPEAKPAKLLQLVGALAIIHKEGMEGLRLRVTGQHGQRTWYALKRVLRSLNLNDQMKYNALRVAESHLHQFVPLRLEDYQLKQEGRK